jgi:hypothetical protein
MAGPRVGGESKRFSIANTIKTSKTPHTHHNAGDLI